MRESVRIWHSSIDDMVTLVAPLSDSEWALQTPCPGWSVADVVAHVVDLESHFLGDPRPDHEPNWAGLPYVTSDMQQFIEIGVDYRRGRSPAELISELRRVTERRAAQLQVVDLDQPVPWFVGEIPLERLLGMRSFDIWTHEQDIRSAIGKPGGNDSPGAQVAWERIRETLPYIWGKKVDTTRTLGLVVTPPGPSGTLILAHDGGRIVYDHAAIPDVQVEITWSDLAARAAGRVPADRVSVHISGDDELARHFLRELAFTP